MASLSERQRRQYRHAVNLLQQGNLDSARQAFARLTRKHPELAAAWFNLGLTQARAHNTAKAIKDLKHGLEHQPANAQALDELGIVYRRSGQFHAARHAYLMALRSDPNDARAHYNLGILYDLYLRQPQNALAQYQDYLANTQHPDKHVKLWIADLQRRIKDKQP